MVQASFFDLAEGVEWSHWLDVALEPDRIEGNNNSEIIIFVQIPKWDIKASRVAILSLVETWACEVGQNNNERLLFELDRTWACGGG